MADEIYDDTPHPQDIYVKEIRAKYRQIFTTKLGVDVLTDILAMCNFGRQLDPNNPQQVAYYNVGLSILKQIGIELNTTDSLNEAVKSILGVRA